MLKKNLFLLMALVLAVMTSVACMAEETASIPDTARPVFEWERDANEHWHVLESGERADAAAHDMVDVVCTICGSEIWAYDDGSADISNYNEYGDMVRYTSWDADGAIVYDTVIAYAYDENGNKLWEKEFNGTVLVAETTYAVNEAGENQPVKSVGYYDDGTWATNEYDEHGNLVKAFSYWADGTVSCESISEYALNADGWYYETKNTTYMGTTIFIHEYNEYGNWVWTYIEEDGVILMDVIYQYGYVNGVMQWSKRYALTEESFYDMEGMETKLIEYMEDGTCIVTEYDAEGNVIE